jgi:hypothetical protein
MITLCWAAKGGSGTSVIAAAMALATTEPTLLIDLDGDQPAVLGLPDPDGPGVHDWLRSEAEPARLSSLELTIDHATALVPAGTAASADPSRWALLSKLLRDDRRRIIVDVGTREPPRALFDVADHTWLVTRPCYLSLRAAVAQSCRPSGVVLIDEPGRALRAGDVETSLGAPIVATTLLDPAIARAVDAGLLVARLPSGLRRQLRTAT